jgi:hypothetical protein
MTIRLLCAYAIYPQNAIITLDAGTETGLVNAKMASTNLTGGVPYVPPPIPNQLVNAQLIVDSSKNVLGILGPSGETLPIGGGGTGLWKVSGPLADATPVVVALGGIATSVYRASVNPVAGDSVLVESGTSATGPWTPWPNGAVGVPDSATSYPSTPAVTHMRFTRTAGGGTTSRYYVNEISN